MTKRLEFGKDLVCRRCDGTGKVEIKTLGRDSKKWPCGLCHGTGVVSKSERPADAGR